MSNTDYRELRNEVEHAIYLAYDAAVNKFGQYPLDNTPDPHATIQSTTDQILALITASNKNLLKELLESARKEDFSYGDPTMVVDVEVIQNLIERMK